MSFITLQDLKTNLINNNSNSALVDKSSLIAIQVDYTNLTPAAKSFVDADVNVANDTVTIANHGFITGLVGRLSSTGTLPAGLATATDYYIISVDANTVKFATSYDNAVAGTAVDITGAIGTGTHTFTPTALNATLKLQSSLDGETWFDVPGKSVNITASGSSLFNLVDFAEPKLRASLSQTAGILDIKVQTYQK